MTSHLYLATSSSLTYNMAITLVLSIYKSVARALLAHRQVDYIFFFQKVREIAADDFLDDNE